MRKTLNQPHTVIRQEMREADGILYKYELTMRESFLVASYGMPLYSISVEMHSQNGELTTAKAVDTFSNPDKAILFFEKLAKNLATPIDLPYILEDEMSN